jgi:predicted ArsR family transcriptional regulator
LRAGRGRGRPAKTFALTDSGRDLFDQAYDDLAAQALRFLRETAGDEAIRAFADRRVAFIKENFADLAQANPELSAAARLAEGYAASTLPMQLCQQHCSHVANEFPQLCEARSISVLGSHVQRLATMPMAMACARPASPHQSLP